MKKLIIASSLFVLIAGVTGCQKKDGVDQDTSFLSTATVGNTGKVFDITNDNSGKVTIIPTGEGVSSFLVKYGHGTGTAGEATVKPGYTTSHIYPEGNYTVTIVSKSLGGQETTATFPLQVTYRAPENLVVKTSGETEVTATATYAKSFMVYYGDVANETGTPMAIGQTLPAHTYPATGAPFTLKVDALSGGAAKTTFTKTLFSLPIDFENANVNYFFGTFGDNQQFSTVANPNPSGLNTSAKVGKFTRGVQAWSGTYSPLDIPINFAYGKKIKVLAYNPDAANIGKQLNVELEWAIGGTPANGVAVLKAPFTTSGAWEELVFDYSGISGIPAGTKFTQLVLRFNDSSDGAGAVVYVDNIRLTN
jgi:hypothetical protein